MFTRKLKQKIENLEKENKRLKEWCEAIEEAGEKIAAAYRVDLVKLGLEIDRLKHYEPARSKDGKFIKKVI